MTAAHDFINQLAYVLAREGQAGVLTHAGDPDDAPGVALKFLLRHPSLRDEAVVNSYGINALIITMPHVPAFVVTPPEKFDILKRQTGDPLPYVLDSVVRRETGGVVVAWTAYVRGRGA
jgi:hypothetical protein